MLNTYINKEELVNRTAMEFARAIEAEINTPVNVIGQQDQAQTLIDSLFTTGMDEYQKISINDEVKNIGGQFYLVANPNQLTASPVADESLRSALISQPEVLIEANTESMWNVIKPKLGQYLRYVYGI